MSIKKKIVCKESPVLETINKTADKSDIWIWAHLLYIIDVLFEKEKISLQDKEFLTLSVKQRLLFIALNKK
uniref:Recombinase n=1 Tax=Strongyloides papillosus TaxID=174720 RepID=A0A0N5BWA4_STREA